MLSKISIAINALLILAVGYLFYKTAAKKEDEVEIAMPSVQENVSSAFDDTSNYKSPVVAYVNGDTIMAYYNYFLDKRKELEASLSKSEMKIEKEIKKAQDEYNELMNYANTQGDKLPPDEQQKISDRIMELDYQIQDLKANEEASLYKNEEKLNKDLMKRIHDYTSSYAQARNIDIVMNYQEVMQVILYGNPAYDITPDIVKGLNELYEKEKSEKIK